MSEIHELRINKKKKKKNNSQSQIEQIDNYKFIRNIIQLHFSLDTHRNDPASQIYPIIIDLHLWPLIIIIIIRFRAFIRRIKTCQSIVFSSGLT